MERVIEEKSAVHTCNFKFDISQYIKMNLISQADFDSLNYNLKEILWTLLQNNSPKSEHYLKNAIAYTLRIWKYRYKVHNNLSYEAMFFCALNIAYSNLSEEDSFHRLEWCHKIQNSLTNDEVKNGWRVCFSQNSYYYVNDRTHSMKQITFHREGGKKSTEE